MNITFYSKPGCPQCKVLKMKLDASKLQYTHIEDENAIVALGVKAAPVLVVNDEIYAGPPAIKWVTNYIKERS